MSPEHVKELQARADRATAITNRIASLKDGLKWVNAPRPSQVHLKQPNGIIISLDNGRTDNAHPNARAAVVALFAAAINADIAALEAEMAAIPPLVKPSQSALAAEPAEEEY